MNFFLQYCLSIGKNVSSLKPCGRISIFSSLIPHLIRFLFQHSLKTNIKSENLLTCSINSIFSYSYTKSKYIIRVYKTLTLLLKLIKTDEEKLIKPNDKKLIKNKTDLENIIILFNKYKDKTNIGEFVEDTNKYCSIINKDEINKDEINKNKINKDEINKDEINKDKINILKCHKYQIFNIIFDLIYNILNYVKLSIKDNTIPFYDLLVIQENKIFKLLDDKKPDKFKTIINKFKNRTKVTPGLPDLKPGPSDLDLNPVGIQ